MAAFLRACHYLTAASSMGLLGACLDRPPGTPEPSTVPVSSTSHAQPQSQSQPQSPSPEAGGDPDIMDDAERARTKAAAEAAMRVVSSAGRDPTGGSFTLADATAGLSGSGALVAKIKTSR